MTILAKPNSVDKGTPALFTLDKAALASLSIIDADDYFRDTNNWDKIRIIYKNSYGGKEEVVFDAANLHPTAEFNLTLRGRGVFDFSSIYIEDFDGGYLLINKDSIPSVSEGFEVTVNLPPPLNLIDWAKLTKIFSLSEDYVGA